MKNVGVIFGGVSCEHDVSIVTALQLIENIDKSKYEVYPIYIHSDGEWYADEKLLDTKIYKEFDSYKLGINKGYIAPNRQGIIISGKGFFAKETFIKLDVVIPAMHGMNGEDGSLQGLLELANIPYTSSGVLGASVGMDKILMKKVFEAHGLPVLPYMYFLREEWEKNKEEILNKIEEKLAYPMFVKPSNLGSSIGISKAKNKDELSVAIDIAKSFDERIIVENGLEDLIEVNCSALGRADDVIASTTEQPISWKEFLTFDEKYMSGVKGGTKSEDKGMASMSRKVPAGISEEKQKEVKELTIKAFKSLHSRGVVRIDFLVDNKDEKVYINEINTIPGSFAFYLWDYDGLKYKDLIDKLIQIAEKENEEKRKNNYTYDSDIVGNFGKGLKHSKM